MENSRFLIPKNALIIGGILFAIPFFVFSYDDRTTHPALTQEIIKLYNHYYEDRPINIADAEDIIQGSIDEDGGTRPLHHFYDPVYNRGLVFDSSLTTEEARLAFIAGGAKSEWKSSKEWAENTLLQGGREYSPTAGIFTDLFISDDDYSWERAIYDYAWKDKKRGLQGLGHILHLIEDASVPDHTRNDPHPPYFGIDASPYEGWTKKFDQSTFTYNITGKESFETTNLLEYFDSLAIYSNNNFFSKDTVCSKDYIEPKPDLERFEKLSDGKIYIFSYRKGKEKVYHRLSARPISTSWIESLNRGECPLFILDNDKLILSDYWERLSKQAVLHGAGVVKLFFDEVEKEKQTKALYNKNRSWLTKTTEKVVDGVKKAAEKTIDGTKKVSEKVVDGVKSAFGSVSTGMIGAYGGLAGVFFGGEDTTTTEESDTQNTEPQPPQEETRSPTPLPTAQTPPRAVSTNTGSQSNNQQRASALPIAPPPPSQTTSPFLPFAGVGGAVPRESPAAEETIPVPAPQIAEIGTTTASTTSSATASTTATTTTPTDESPVSIAPPIILEPDVGTSTFATTTLSFIGTAEPNRIIQETTIGATTTSDTDGVWMLTFFSLPEGTTTLTFFASDSDGHTSSATPRTIFIYVSEATSSPPDDTPPRAPAGPMPGPVVGDIAETPMLYSPRSLVITDDGAKALIADKNRISELDLASGRVRTVTSGVKGPTRMAIEASGETALVLEAGRSGFPGDPIGRLIRVNLLTGEKTVLATGLDSPRGIAIEREGETALVRAGSGIYRMDLLTGSTTLLAYANINGDIAIDSSGAYAIFLTEELFRGLGVLKKIDLATNEVTTVAGPFEGSIRGDAIELSPDGTFALVIVAGGDTGIKKIDLATGEESYLFSTGPAMFGSYSITDVALSPDTSEALFWWTSPNEGLMLNRINLTNREGATIARARTPRAIANTQDGSSVITAGQAYFGWFFDEGELENGIGTRLAGFAENATSFALFPNDTEIVTTNVSYDFISSVKRVNLATGLISTIATNLPSHAIQIAIEASNETALVSATGLLLRINLTTGETTVISDTIDGAGPIAIGNTGANVFLASSNGVTTSLLRVDLASGTTTRIADMGAIGALAGIGLDPDGENAVVGSTETLVRVNLLSGETTTILSTLCEEASIRAMALESTGETALVSHDTCGLVRVRVK